MLPVQDACSRDYAHTHVCTISEHARRTTFGLSVKNILLWLLQQLHWAWGRRGSMWTACISFCFFLALFRVCALVGHLLCAENSSAGFQGASESAWQPNFKESKIRVQFVNHCVVFVKHLAVEKHCAGEATCLLSSVSDVQLSGGFQFNEALQHSLSAWCHRYLFYMVTLCITVISQALVAYAAAWTLVWQAWSVYSFIM